MRQPSSFPIPILFRSFSSSSPRPFSSIFLRTTTTTRTSSSNPLLTSPARKTASFSTSARRTTSTIGTATLDKSKGPTMVFNLSTLHDKTVLITGASAGIGASASVLFSRAGSNVILLARRLPQLQTLKEECIKANKEGGTGKGGKVTVVDLDMKDRQGIKGLVERIRKEGGGDVDVLVNNAGLVKGVEKVGDIAEEDIDTMIDTNVVGLIHLTQVFVNEFKKRNTGHVINLGSIAGREPYPNGSIYCATKAAVRSFSSSLLKELINTKIRVSEIQPGMVETEFSVIRFRGDKSKADKVYEGLEPLTAQDIAEEIVWIASRPERVNVAELFVLPSAQGGAQLAHRST